jgi:hypothetical protein
MVFSPLGQNNALILVAPMLLWMVSLESLPLVVAALLALVVPYSDLLPLEAREWGHSVAVKQMLLLAIAGWAGWREYTTVASRRLPL